jgi:hypothetical protein
MGGRFFFSTEVFVEQIRFIYLTLEFNINNLFSPFHQEHSILKIFIRDISCST